MISTYLREERGLEVGQGLKESRWAEPQRRQNEAAGDLPAERLPSKARALDMKRHHPPDDAESSHTDHAPSAAAAPTPCACVGTVTECIKAQDSPDTIPNQHHLGERVAPSGGAAVEVPSGGAA